MAKFSTSKSKMSLSLIRTKCVVIGPIFIITQDKRNFMTLKSVGHPKKIGLIRKFINPANNMDFLYRLSVVQDLNITVFFIMYIFVIKNISTHMGHRQS